MQPKLLLFLFVFWDAGSKFHRIGLAGPQFSCLVARTITILLYLQEGAMQSSASSGAGKSSLGLCLLVQQACQTVNRSLGLSGIAPTTIVVFALSFASTIAPIALLSATISTIALALPVVASSISVELPLALEGAGKRNAGKRVSQEGCTIVLVLLLLWLLVLLLRRVLGGSLWGK